MKLSPALVPGLLVSALLASAFAIGCGSQSPAAATTTNPTPTSAGLTIVSTTPGDTSTAYRDHPDPAICVGPAHVMEFNGLNVVIRAKSAVGAVVSSTTQANFSSKVVTQSGGGGFNSTGTMEDPACYYDPIGQRWFAVEDDGSPTSLGTGLWIAVSATSDPTGPWHGFLDIPPQINSLEPFIAADKNGFYVCAYDGTGTVPISSQFCDAFPIADMEWSGSTYPSPTHRSRLQGLQQSSRPVVDTNPNKSPSANFVIAARSGAAQNCAAAPCTWGWLVTLVGGPAPQPLSLEEPIRQYPVL